MSGFQGIGSNVGINKHLIVREDCVNNSITHKTAQVLMKFQLTCHLQTWRNNWVFVIQSF